jgi:hypothetical protein
MEVADRWNAIDRIDHCHLHAYAPFANAAALAERLHVIGQMDVADVIDQTNVHVHAHVHRQTNVHVHAHVHRLHVSASAHANANAHAQKEPSPPSPLLSLPSHSNSCSLLPLSEMKISAYQQRRQRLRQLLMKPIQVSIVIVHKGALLIVGFMWSFGFLFCLINEVNSDVCV